MNNTNDMLVKKTTGFAILLLSILSISCESKFKDIKNIHAKATFFPDGVAENINLQYLDSGKVKAILLSDKMLDYSKVKYSFNEFPDGIHLTFFDSNNQKNTVVADYAISYATTELIDLRGNVVITTFDNKKLEADQLYYDQKRDWFYTNGRYKASSNKDNFTQGIGVDFDGQLNIIKARNSYAESLKNDN